MAVGIIIGGPAGRAAINPDVLPWFKEDPSYFNFCITRNLLANRWPSYKFKGQLAHCVDLVRIQKTMRSIFSLGSMRDSPEKWRCFNDRHCMDQHCGGQTTSHRRMYPIVKTIISQITLTDFSVYKYNAMSSHSRLPIGPWFWKP